MASDREATAADGYVFEGQGLYITRTLSLAEWRKLGQAIGVQLRRREGSQWALGDWLVAGGRRKEADYAWCRGEGIYDEAAKITGLDKATLGNYYAVSVAFPRGDRFPRLTWTHHREALRMLDGEMRSLVLKRAGDENWPCTQLTEYVTAMGLHQATQYPAGRTCRKPDRIANTDPRAADHWGARCASPAHGRIPGAPYRRSRDTGSGPLSPLLAPN